MQMHHQNVVVMVNLVIPIIKMNISVIGLGTVGIATFKEISKKYKNIIGIDIDLKKLKKLKNYNVFPQIKKSEIYLINVYSSEEIIKVLNIIKTIKHEKKPLIIIESTIDPKFKHKIINLINKIKSNLVICPHRLNPKDKFHQVFNLNRVIAGLTKECLKRGVLFYSNFMNKKLLIKTDIDHAIMSKLVENTYRFIEIAIAEELSLLCKTNKELNLDFKKLRKCVNSKWNIEIKEARKGIGGKCLPKDTLILNNFFKKNKLITESIKINEKYKQFNLHNSKT